MTVPRLHAVSWNLTARCNLRCGHCYLDAGRRAGAADLSTKDCLRIVGELASVNPNLLLILTGGEPLLRPDLEVIAGAAAARGMTVVVGTGGTLLDARAAARLKACGVSGVGISLDAAYHPGLHNQLRGRPGAWEAAVAGLRVCREQGLDVALHTSVFRWNRAELPAVAELAARLGAKAWNVYFLVCTGRGQGLTDLAADEYEAALRELRNLQRAMEGRLLVAVRCAPHFRRVAAGDGAARLHAYATGCPAGDQYVRIGVHGEVTPCPYLPAIAGVLGEQTFPEIWRSAPLLLRLRDRRGLQGRCGACCHRDGCGGCRARAFAATGEVMAEDPSCAFRPEPAEPQPSVPPPTFGLALEQSIPWTAEAQARLQRVPSFLRGFVVRRVEEETRRRGEAQVTPEVLQAVRARAPQFTTPLPGNPSQPVRLSAAEGGAEAPASVPGLERGGHRCPPHHSPRVTRGIPASDPPASPDAEARTPPDAQRTSPVWSTEAARRVENAPDFVRPGVRKLVELRAAQQGRQHISSEFLSEIRDESMMRVAQIIRRFGLDGLRPEAFAEARRRMAKDEAKLRVLDQLDELLRRRRQNPEIREKFRRFIEAAPLRGRPWLPEAEAQLDGLPEATREAVRNAIEEEARQLGAPVVTPGLVKRVAGLAAQQRGPP